MKSPGHDSEHDDNVPSLAIAGVHDAAGNTVIFLAVNRHATETIDGTTLQLRLPPRSRQMIRVAAGQ